MKRFLKLFSVLLVVVMMTGCVKYDFDMKITNDKKMNVSAILASSVGFDNSVKKKFEDAGFKVENYKDDTYTGIKITKTYKNIDNISSSDEVVVDLNSFSEGTEPKTFFKKDGNKYSAKFKFDTSSATGTDSSNDTEDNDYDSTDNEIDYSGLEANMEIQLVVEVPKLISSNATKTDGNKLTWDLTKHTGDITFEFEATGGNFISNLTGSSNKLIMYCAIGCGVIVLIIVIGLLVKKSKKTPETVTSIENPTTPTEENKTE